MVQIRKGWIDLLRIAACIMVVGVHVSALCLGDLDVNSINFKIMNGFDCFSILGVPLFVMISGSLILDESYTVSIRNLYLKKAACYAVLYFVWLLIYNVENFIYNGSVWSLEAVKDEIILESLFGRGIYHLWFLPMICTLYLATPFIKSFADDKRLCLLFLSVYAVAAVIIPTLLKFEFPYKAIMFSIYGQFPLAIFTGYAGYYLMGHVLNRYLPKLTHGWLTVTAAVGIVFFAAEVHVCNSYSVKTGKLSIILNDTMGVTVFVCCCCIFILFKHLTISDNNILRRLSGLTFGIYLLHPMVLEFINRMGIDTLFAPAYISVPLVTALVFGITAAFVFIFGRMPIVRWLF